MALLQKVKQTTSNFTKCPEILNRKVCWAINPSVVGIVDECEFLSVDAFRFHAFWFCFSVHPRRDCRWQSRVSQNPAHSSKPFFIFFRKRRERRMGAWFEGGANCNEWPGINFFYFFRFCSLTKIFCFVTIRGWSAGCGGSSVYLSTVLIVAIAPHIYFFFLFLFINWEI